MRNRLYKICVYVPEEACEAVKNALFDAGAGKIGDYEHCAFSIKGAGQFKPLANAKPAIGQLHQLETVDEIKLELVCDKAFIKAALVAMIAAHPYEEPAYQVFECLDLSDL